jgi:hypothetical protein
MKGIAQAGNSIMAGAVAGAGAEGVVMSARTLDALHFVLGRVISDGVAIAFGEWTLVPAVLVAATERISCAGQQSLDFFLVVQCRLTNAWVKITRRESEETKQHIARHSSPVHLTSLSVSLCRIPERPPYSKWNNSFYLWERRLHWIADLE